VRKVWALTVKVATVTLGGKGRQNVTCCVQDVSGFGGLGVSMLPSGTQDRGFAPDRSRLDFSSWKNPQHAFLQRGSKRISPMSQLWGMLKNSALFVNSEIAGQIPLVPSSASRVCCVSDWYTAPLVV
jgi:hypothetical protein